MSLIKSSRGRELLLVEHHTFSKQKVLKSEEVFWRCIQRNTKCSAKVFTIGSDDLTITRSYLVHNHEANPQKLERKGVTNACKRKAEEDISEKPAKIIRTAIAKFGADSLTVPDIAAIRKNIYNCRRKLLPGPLPRNISEVHDAVSNYSPKTCRDEIFLFLNHLEFNIIVFSCETNIRLLCKLKTLYMDGTFSYSTKYFLQLFTIHGLENGHYVPLAYCLLKDKMTLTYKHLFSSLKSKIFEIFQIPLEPSEIFVDFEKAIHNALLDTWPNVKISGCRFHLHQNWFKKIQSLGLVQEYRDTNSEIGKWLKHTFGLTCLNPVEVEECFVYDLMSYKPENKTLDIYADYLLENYIIHNALFPPNLWANQNPSIARTTNACESFHSRFNFSFYSTHPSIFIFIEKLKEFQVETYVKINSLQIPAKIKDTAVKAKLAFLEKMVDKLQSQQISRLDFIKAVSYHSYNINK